MLQRGFPLSGMNFDSPGAAGKKFPRQKAREYFLVLQQGFPLTGINFDSPGAAGKNIPPPKGEGIFFGAPAGIRTPIELRIFSAYHFLTTLLTTFCCVLRTG